MRLPIVSCVFAAAGHTGVPSGTLSPAVFGFIR